MMNRGCTLYTAQPIDPDREFYGTVQQCCGTCQHWDNVKEKCREEEKLKGGPELCKAVKS